MTDHNRTAFWQAVAALRAILASLTEDERIEALQWQGYCEGCGTDMLRPDGTIRYCQCRNDE